MRHSEGRAGAARVDVYGAIELDPTDARFFELRARLLQEANNPVGALADYDRAVAIDPGGVKAVDARELRAGLLVATGRYRDAIADFDIILRSTPERGAYLSNRGLARLRLLFDSAPSIDAGDYRKALDDFDRAIPLMNETRKVSGHFNRAELLTLGGDLSRAIGDYDRAIALEPDHVLYLVQRARAHRLSGDVAAAQADLDAASMLEMDAVSDDRLTQEIKLLGPPTPEEARQSHSVMLKVVAARPSFVASSGIGMVTMELDAASAELFAVFTRNHVGARTQVWVGDAFLMGPTIERPLNGPSITVSGAFDAAYAEFLAGRLRETDADLLVRAPAHR